MVDDLSSSGNSGSEVEVLHLEFENAHDKTNSSSAPEVMTRSCISSSMIIRGLVSVVLLVFLTWFASPGRLQSGLSVRAQMDNLNSSYVMAEEGAYHEQLNPPGTCILDQSKLPREWMPPSHLSFQDSGETWTKEEQQLADNASQKGLDELVDFYDSIPEKRIMDLFTDAANSLIDQCFASTNRPNFHDKACKSASRVLKIIATYFTNDLDSGKRAGCEGMRKKSKMLAYAHYLSKVLPGDSKLKETRNKLVEVVITSIEECRNLDEYLHVSKKSWETNLDLNNLSLSRNTLKNYIHQQGLINLYSIPEFDLPEEFDRFVARIWKFVAQYKYINGVDVEQGYGDKETRHHGYLVTHIAYWPTGYGRHVQLVDDAPWLYEYIRKNFWSAMETGGLDLCAEFLDILRQCGCTEDNDLMVRHGARYFLKMYQDLGSTWMPKTNWSDYSRIHLPWTGIGALRRKEVEPLVPGSMGYGFKKALERGAEKDNPQVP